jgi:choline dehydrogenase
LDAKFWVRGVAGLRVVHASVFPKIPGILIQAPLFMVSEKAGSVILDDVERGLPVGVGGVSNKL